MGVARDCYIKGYHISDETEKIIAFQDLPDKWSQMKEEYWNKYIDFILAQNYYYKDFYVIVEYKSSDYGMHDITVYKNGEKVFEACTYDDNDFRKESEIVFALPNHKIIVLYRKSSNDFLIEVSK